LSDLLKKTPAKQFDCDLCGKIFVSQKNLNADIQKYHDGNVVEKKVKKGPQKTEDIVEDMNLDILFMNCQVMSTLPKSVQSLVNPDDIQYVVPSDGACGATCASVWLFQDHKFGPNLRKVMNNHVVDRWDFYKDKVTKLVFRVIL